MEGITHVFISYSRRDVDLKNAVCKQLKDGGIPYWIDENDIPLGADWENQLLQNIRQAKVLLLLLTDAALVSDWVTREWNHALENSVTVITLQQIESLPEKLAKYQALDFRTEEKPWVKLIVELQKHLSTASRPQGITRIPFTGLYSSQDGKKVPRRKYRP